MAEVLDDKMWARAPLMSPKFAAQALQRFNSHMEFQRTSLLEQRMRASWQNYYARTTGGLCDDTQINYAGDKGEVVMLSSRRYRRLIQDQIGLVQQTPPDYQPEAINTDPESQAQCSLALGILDQYKRRAHLEDIHIERSEMALVLSASYLHVRWDGDAGEEALPDDGSGRPMFEGDLVFSVRSPMEVAYDRQSPDRRRPRWWVVQEPANRWDILAKFGGDSPELARAIETAPAWSSITKAWEFEKELDKYDESIPVYWVYYEPCKAVPEGRKALVLDGHWVLLDGPLDEDRAGVFRLAPSDVMLRSEGHTNNFDGMAIMKALSAQGSAIQSNHSNYGLLRMLAARESNVDTHKLDTGFAAVDWSAFDTKGNALPKPEVLNLLKSQPEMLDWFKMLAAEADTIMGGSPVTRGDPEATKGDSGSKAAMLFAAAQNIGSGFVRAKLRSDEEVATFIIGSIRRHATVERITSIVGKNSTYTAKRFKGEDLKRISRVNVRQANPARDTFQGRMALAELLADKTPEQQQQIIALVNTGRIEPITEDTETERLLIERENEALRDAAMPMPVTVDSENHMEHALKHMKCKNDPSIRGDKMLMQRHDQHIAEHIGRLTPGHEMFAGFPVLMLTGQKPLPSVQEFAAMSAGLMPASGTATPDTGKPAAEADTGAPPKPNGTTPTAKPQGGAPAKMPEQPKNPATGERVNLPVPDAPAMGT